MKALSKSDNYVISSPTRISSSVKYPLIYIRCGIGTTTDTLVKNQIGTLFNYLNKIGFEAYLVAPILGSGGWTVPDMNKDIDWIKSKYSNVDPTKIIYVGISLGTIEHGTDAVFISDAWAGAKYPKYFTHAILLAGSPNGDFNYDQIIKSGVKTFAGQGADENIPEMKGRVLGLVSAVTKAASKTVLAMVLPGGHMDLVEQESTYQKAFDFLGLKAPAATVEPVTPPVTKPPVTEPVSPVVTNPAGQTLIDKFNQLVNDMAEIKGLLKELLKK